MNNRVLKLLLCSLLFVASFCSNVFAEGLIINYAHNIDAIEGTDSLNYLVSATSDGGYLIGTCMLDGGTYDPNTWIDEIGECSFYLSKFRVDGSREWMSAVEISSNMISIGEMANDYRIMTEDGFMLSFDKNSGEYLKTDSINLTEIWRAGFYTDDTVVAYGSEDFYKYNKDGDQIGVFPFQYGESGYCNFNLATFSNGDFAFACGPGANNLVRVSRDLSSSEELFRLNDAAWIVAVDEDEYVLTTLGVCNSSSSCTYTNMSYDMTGNTLASMEFSGSMTNISMFFIGGYYFVNNNEHTIKKMSPEFEPIFEYNFNENEAFYAATSLKDNSVVGVGLSSTATANYSINSDNNGIYYRWVDEDVPVIVADSESSDVVENPSTLDDAIAYGLILLVSTGSALMIVARCKR